MDRRRRLPLRDHRRHHSGRTARPRTPKPGRERVSTDLCPVAAWRAWTGYLDRLSPRVRRGPAFRPIDRHGQLRATRLAARAIADTIVARATRWDSRGLGRTQPTPGVRHRGLRPRQPRIEIMRHGRWRATSTMRGYLDEGTRTRMTNPSSNSAHDRSVATPLSPSQTRAYAPPPGHRSLGCAACGSNRSPSSPSRTSVLQCRQTRISAGSRATWTSSRPPGRCPAAGAAPQPPAVAASRATRRAWRCSSFGAQHPVCLERHRVGQPRELSDDLVGRVLSVGGSPATPSPARTRRPAAGGEAGLGVGAAVRTDRWWVLAMITVTSTPESPRRIDPAASTR